MKTQMVYKYFLRRDMYNDSKSTTGGYTICLNLLAPKSVQNFCKILKNKRFLVKALPKRFHLNGDTIGFRSQTQKLKLH